MGVLEEVIEIAERLSQKLEKIAENEKMFCDDLCLEMERYSWEVFRMKNSIQQLKEVYGG